VSRALNSRNFRTFSANGTPAGALINATNYIINVIAGDRKSWFYITNIRRHSSSKPFKNFH